MFESFDDFSKHGLQIVIRNGKTFHLLCIFYHHDLFMYVYLTFIAQYSNILHPSYQFSYNIVLLFNLYTEVKILTFANKNVRPDMATRKVSNKKFIKRVKRF